MSCPEYKGPIIDVARGFEGGGVPRHLGSCDACAAFFEEQLALSDAARLLAEPGTTLPKGLEIALLREFDATWPKRTPRRKLFWTPVAVAAALIFAFWFYPAKRPAPVVTRPAAPRLIAAGAAAPVEQPKAAEARRRARKAVPKDSNPFIAIPYTIPLAPYERAQVMQVEMPVAELIAAGIPINTSDPGAQARADVLVGDDGRARAFRLISISERSIER